MSTRSVHLRLPVALTLPAAIAISACGAAQSEATPLEARNASRFTEAITTAGQPSESDIEKAAELGYSAVINLRGPGETGNWDAAARVEELGMTYVSQPIAGAEGVNWSAARQLQDHLGELAPTAEKPVLVHCGSSNRVGALFALSHYLDEAEGDLSDADRSKLIDASLETGKRAGLSSLEPLVRGLLEAGPDAP